MNENPELIRVNEKVVKRNPGYVREPFKIEKPKDVISDKFKQMVTGENGANPYIDQNDAEGIAAADRILKKLKEEAFGQNNKESNN